jgi:hypothetical protein
LLAVKSLTEFGVWEKVKKGLNNNKKLKKLIHKIFNFFVSIKFNIIYKLYHSLVINKNLPGLSRVNKI